MSKIESLARMPSSPSLSALDIIRGATGKVGVLGRAEEHTRLVDSHVFNSAHLWSSFSVLEQLFLSNS